MTKGLGLGLGLSAVALFAAGSIPFVYHAEDLKKEGPTDDIDAIAEQLEIAAELKRQDLAEVVAEVAKEDLLIPEFLTKVKKVIESEKGLLVDKEDGKAGGIDIETSLYVNREEENIVSYVLEIEGKKGKTRYHLSQEILVGNSRVQPEVDLFSYVDTGFPESLPKDEMPIITDKGIHVLTKLELDAPLESNYSMYVTPLITVTEKDMENFKGDIGLSPLTTAPYGDVEFPYADMKPALIEDGKLMDTENKTVAVSVPEEGLNVCTGHEILTLMVDPQSLKGQNINVSCGADVNIMVYESANYLGMPVPLDITSANGIDVDVYVDSFVNLADVEMQGNLHLLGDDISLDSINVSGAVVAYAKDGKLRLGGTENRIGGLLAAHSTVQLDGPVLSNAGAIIGTLKNTKNARLDTAYHLSSDEVTTLDLPEVTLASPIFWE